MPRRRVLGIDPGVGRCGWAIVTVDRSRETLDASGCIITPARLTLPERLLRIANELEKVLVAFPPDAVAVEQLYFTKNVTTAMAVSHARGVILLAAARHQLPVVELSPTTVKQSITGYGRADKRQVLDMLTRLLNLPPARRTDDEIDAIGIALTSAHQRPR